MSAVIAPRKAARTKPLRLSATLRAPGAAREWLTEWLRAAGVPPVLMDDALVAVSELVTNAYLHVNWQIHPGTIEIYGQLDAEMLTIEVHDPSMETPLPASEFDALGETGKGLRLVKAVTSELECRIFPGGKAVIVKLAIPKSTRGVCGHVGISK